MSDAGDGSLYIAPAAHIPHIDAQPSGVAGLLNGTSVPGTERDTERMELDNHWNSSRKRKPFKRNGWRTADKKEVKNRDLWERIDALLQNHDVKWVWVKGHAGHVENERVDAIARAHIPRPASGSADGYDIDATNDGADS